MKTQHTPGPWSVTGNEIRKSEGVPMLLATVNNSEGAKMNGYDYEANARLIAAAPELLEALKEMLRWTDGNCSEEPLAESLSVAENNAKSAIRKALGNL